MGGASIINTPGYYYAVAYWLAVCLYSRALPKRFSKVVTWGIRLAGLAALTVFMIVTGNAQRVLFVLGMTVIIAAMYLLILLTCDVERYKGGYYCMRAFLLGEFMASLEWQIYFYLMEEWPVLRGWLWNILIMTVIYSLLFLFVHYLDVRLAREDFELQIGKREFLTAMSMALVVFVISNVSYFYSNTPFSSSSSKEVFIIRTLSDLGGVAILYAYHLQLMQMQSLFESQYLRKMIDMQYANYQISEQSVELVNQKYHDLKHQIAILRDNALDNEAVVNSMNAMEQEIKSYEAQNKTGNKVLDTILTSKSLYCQNLGIQLNPVVDGALCDFMDVMDLSALFGNILDNAIEGSLEVSDREKRLIHLTVVQQKGFLRIRSENYFEGDVKFENGVLRTSKSDRQFHGFGTRSIQSIAHKYGGSATFEAKGHWFEVRVLIPL